MSASTLTHRDRPAQLTGTDKPAALWRAGLRPSGVALLAAAAVFLIADATTGELLARQGSAVPEPVLLGHVLGSTTVGSLAAVLLAWASRFAARPRSTFVTIATVGTILYSAMPFVATDDLRSALVLVLLHVVVAVPLVIGLRGHVVARR